MTHRDIDDFAAIEPEFRARVDRMVWCNVATVDARGNPSSRLLHPIWEGPIAWIGTHRDSAKGRHLARNPRVSLAFISDPVHPVYVDAIAAWADDPATKQHVWDLFLHTPEPVGYDPTSTFIAPDHPNFGVLRIEPLRIVMATLGGDPWQQIWRKPAG